MDWIQINETILFGPIVKIINSFDKKNSNNLNNLLEIIKIKNIGLYLFLWLLMPP